MAIEGVSSLRRNDVTALALAALVALAPVPLGSNRPVLWIAVDTLVFLILFAQTLMRLFETGERDRFLPRRAAFPVLFAIVALWHLVQVLPLGFLLPGPEAGLGGYGATISLVPGQTILMLLNFLAYGSVAVLAYQTGQRPERARRLFAFAALMVALFALYALYVLAAEGNALLGLPRQYYVEDAAGTFVNRNSFATFLGLGLVVNTALMAEGLFGAEKGARIAIGAPALHGLAGAVILAALFATHSRMGLFASIVGATLALALFVFPSRSGRRLKLAGGGLILAGSVTLAVLYGGGVIERLTTSQSNPDQRMDIYAQVVELIGHRPLLGFGAGGFEAAFPLVHHLPVSPDRILDKAHNTYLTLMVELGIPVGLLAIALIGLMAFRFARALGQGAMTRLGAAIGLATTAQVGLHSLVDFSLEIHAVALLYAFILGLALAATGGGRVR